MIVASFIHDWFGWPNGAVLTNLVASFLLGVPVIGKLYHKIHKHQKRVEKHLGIED
jgi:fluoride ion exporter CrcB/FEX